MPEGHTLHRLAGTLADQLARRRLRVSSPQGRFADSARLLDGTELRTAEAYGKHLFLTFEVQRVVHVHLGLYGRLDVLPGPPPPPVGQVRLRLVADGDQPAYADLRGATACELLEGGRHGSILDRLGPDPLRPDADWLEAWERVRRSRAPLGGLLMDQSVLAGVGNVFRAELLFRHRLHPLRPGRTLRRGRFEAMWRDLVGLMRDGVATGRIETVRPEHAKLAQAAVDGRGRGTVYVYRRQGLPCLVCGSLVRTDVLAGRNLFWCPRCQPVFRSRAGGVAAVRQPSPVPPETARNGQRMTRV